MNVSMSVRGVPACLLALSYRWCQEGRSLTIPAYPISGRIVEHMFECLFSFLRGWYRLSVAGMLPYLRFRVVVAAAAEKKTPATTAIEDERHR